MKKCVVVCSENCKSRNVLFSENITKGIKNRMLEKINNVNVRFLVLSVYKVQNRLLSRTPASDCVSAWKSTNKTNEPPRFPQWKPGRFFIQKRNRFFVALMNWRRVIDSRRAEAYLWNRKRNRAINSMFLYLARTLSFWWGTTRCAAFFICGDKIQKVRIIVHIICYARYMEGTHRKRSKNAKDVE